MTTQARRRVIVGITGASGVIFGIRTLERLREFDVETHVIISAWGAKNIKHETRYSVEQVRALADVAHRPNDQGATISSGSFETSGMIIAPCSMKTLAQIASGVSDDLITRAADVILKERRGLVLLARESPLSQIHLANMMRVAQAGAIVLPPVPAFYNNPTSLDDMVDHIVTRALDQLQLHSSQTPRWDGEMGIGYE